jgi:hypothetical protein
MPKGDQYDPVSTTVNPVTDTAEVEVKRALLKEAEAPGSRDMGSESKSAPTIINTAKPRATMLALRKAEGVCLAMPLPKKGAFLSLNLVSKVPPLGRQ